RTPLLHLSTRRRRALLSLTLLARFEETEFLLIALAPPFIERVLLTDGRTDKTFKLFARSFCHARHQAPVVSHAMARESRKFQSTLKRILRPTVSVCQSDLVARFNQFERIYTESLKS